MRIVVESYVARGRSWWTERSGRERMLVMVFGGLAAMALVLLLVVKPLQATWADAIADIRTYESLNERLRAAGPDLGRRAAYGDGSLSTIVTGSAATAGLMLQRLDPEGGGIRVSIADAPYDSIVAWLTELDRHGGAHVSELKLNRAPTPGMVGAELLLQP